MRTLVPVSAAISLKLRPSIVCEQHVALRLGELAQGQFDLFEQHLAGEGYIGTGVGRGKHVAQE